MALIDKLTAIGNAIREKTGTTALIPLALTSAAVEFCEIFAFTRLLFLISVSVPFLTNFTVAKPPELIPTRK